MFAELWNGLQTNSEKQCEYFGGSIALGAGKQNRQLSVCIGPSSVLFLTTLFSSLEFGSSSANRGEGGSRMVAGDSLELADVRCSGHLEVR